MKKISTSALAKIHGTAAKELFNQFTEQGFIVRDGESWALTKAGESNGGEYQESAKFGKYIVWPESIQIESQGEVDSTQTSQSLMTAKNLASHFDIS
ncbi:MAG: glycerol kinase, partial [Gammaproteobacteria bacterium]|nr:glycerol kinase [Gammaproteobacteria bacterium]